MPEWLRINGIRSVSGMKGELERLDPETRIAVVKEGLARSRFQFTWSFFAKHFGLPEEEWPTQMEAR